MTSGKNNQFTKSNNRKIQYDNGRKCYNISIPKQVAERLRLQKNDVLSVKISRNKIILEPVLLGVE